MIFPIDINKRIMEKGKIAGDNLTQLVITLFVVGNVVGVFAVNWVVSSFLGGGLGKTFLILLCLNVVIGIFVFRYVIFDENTKIAEYLSFEDDSFAKYMNVRKDVKHSANVNGEKIPIIEFSDGSASCTLEFRFGSNDNIKAKRTAEIMQEIYKVIAIHGFEARTCVASEDFASSKEFEEYMKRINSIEHPKLRDVMILTVNSAMEESRKRSCVNCVYLTIRSLNSYSRAELETVMHKVLTLVLGGYSAFRAVKALDVNGALEFYRYFYGISAIDLSMMKVIEMSDELNKMYNKVVNVYALETLEGSFYKAKEE